MDTHVRHVVTHPQNPTYKHLPMADEQTRQRSKQRRAPPALGLVQFANKGRSSYDKRKELEKLERLRLKKKSQLWKIKKRLANQGILPAADVQVGKQTMPAAVRRAARACGGFCRLAPTFLHGRASAPPP